MKKLLLTLFFLSIFTAAYSQQKIFGINYNGSVLTLNRHTFFRICDTTHSGNYLLAGSASGHLGSSYAYAVVDKNGAPLWVKDSAIFTSIGKHWASFSYGLRTHDHGFVFCGSLSNFGTANESAIFILKTDSSGNELWRKNVQQFQLGNADVIYQSPDSSLYFTGFRRDSISNILNSFLLKLSNSGDVLFMRQFPLIGIENYLLSIENKFIIGGATSYIDSATQKIYNKISLISTDTSGNFLSSHSLIDSTYTIYLGSISKTADNNILISCSKQDSTQQGFLQLMKVDTAANIIWTDTISTNQYYPIVARELPNGNILIAYGDYYVEERNSLGDTIWTYHFDDNVSNFASSTVNSMLALDNSTFLISGRIGYSSPSGSSPYLMKISNLLPSPIFELDAEDSFIIYPNPASNNFSIRLKSELKDAKLEIVNVIGEKLYSFNLKNKEERFNANLQPGIYFVRVGENEEYFYRKLIIQ
ncbi:MAG: T9SS C-terminal target domain-containing protein [Bacteroidetes bacterium]|nr:MAG: T9SS C-terminal target domain-containing protein [Bacteroidota bacterium]REK05740.1 MAG: T9SS C-terminal target domain-containing protein [Bacteroidota bacterium]REK31954.1 MAG: T9SS C-terminal target domain-containing protein [Bacteroidota bacterium]REK50019.1 MAG: T9SS C-terminal target domain-containing protein [Bacteroidota bacterium]